MKLCVYAHPFDLQALAGHGGLARLRDLGIGEVALATSYHDGRWLMPWHPGGVVRFLEDGCVHFRPRGDYGQLQPRVSSSVPATGPSPLERLAQEATRTGTAVRAWTVFTHNSRLGEAHPQQCVQNAFGDLYRYALCPAQPAVRQYTAAMVRDLAAHDVQTIELEALGQMGFKHSSHHDKASFTPSGLLDAALSACFCDACSASMAAAGADPERLQAAVVAFVQTQVRDGDAMAPTKVPAAPAELAASGLDTGWLAAVLATRARTLQELGAAVVDATPRTARAVQVHPNPWFTGSQLSLDTAAVAFPASDERVLTCYGDGPDAIAKMLASPGLAAVPHRRVCLWPKAPQFGSDDDLARVRDLCQRAGVATIAIYHLGLLPWRTLERAAKMLSA